jgi:sigma-B regulation protein RsbU (phosphoserine phosphatase)
MPLDMQVGSPEADRAAAAALQRSLLPDTLPQLNGLELAARYVPAEGALGGDWYDVFALPDGTVGIVMGDVMGHGLGPAIVMGRLRSSLRSYALDHHEPDEVLRRLDRKIHHFEPGAMATAAYAVTAPPYDRIRISSAGHLPPILTCSGDVGQLLDVPPDLPLGIDVSHPRRATDIYLPAGATLALYTDGLVDRRPLPGQRLDADTLSDNLSRLAAAVAPGPVAAAAAAALRAMLGDAPSDDDIAILLIRRTG